MEALNLYRKTVTIGGVPHEFTDQFGPYFAKDGDEPEVVEPAPMPLEKREHRVTEIRTRLGELDKEYEGRQFTPSAKAEWNDLNAERDEQLEAIAEIKTRQEAIREASKDPDRIEPTDAPRRGRRQTATGDDIWDLSTVPRDYVDPHGEQRELVDRARRAVEQATFPSVRASEDAEVRQHISKLLEGSGGVAELEELDSRAKAVAKRILVTGNPAYQRAFGKYVTGRETAMTSEERAALAVGAGGTGGFAIVYTLDPTVIPVSNLSVNPYRRICRTETIAGTNEWRGVTSQGVTAAYAAEATEASDNSPTLVQPAAIVQRAQVFIPFSVEIAQDWGGLQGEMASLIQDSKDDLEATQFTTGVGTTVFPQGILTGATTTVPASTLLTFSSPDPYLLEQNVPPRFRPRSQWVANRAIWSRLRQFDTAGGAQLWQYVGQGLPNNVPDGGNLGANVLGYPANECSAMTTAVTTGSKIMVLGDFSKMVIVDRVGMDIEVIPNLFGLVRGFPTGQRGLFAMWRNTSKVLDPNPFRVLTT